MCKVWLSIEEHSSSFYRKKYIIPPTHDRPSLRVTINFVAGSHITFEIFVELAKIAKICIKFSDKINVFTPDRYQLS